MYVQGESCSVKCLKPVPINSIIVWSQCMFYGMNALIYPYSHAMKLLPGIEKVI